MDERQQREAFWAREHMTWPHRELSRFVEAGGIRWHVQRSGVGPAVLLVHGAGASSHSWRQLIPILSAAHSVLAVDLPGHGFTDAPAGRHSSMHAMSESLAALLHEVAFDPEFCVGHSAGVAILCHMSLDRRVHPRAIVGINAALLPFGGMARAAFSSVARVLASHGLFAKLLAVRARRAGNVARVLAGTGSRLGPDSVRLYERLVSNPQHLSGVLQMMANWDVDRLERVIPALPVPLVLLVGMEDRAVPPAQATEVARRVAGARVVPLPGLGHLAHEEAPQRVAEQILQVFAEMSS